jgi:excinuclease ABC subunit C|tara:strand:- start:3540 stop:5387 length:1848 start_codon:yes stop_codon:yes gene_type:complete
MTITHKNFNYRKGLDILKVASTNFPSGSGVYKFLDERESPLYVGKAKNLKKRIFSYINDNKQTRRIKTLISLTHRIDFIKTPTELDALILENNLIKNLKPMFNIRLMDDKSYPFIMIGLSNKWARIKKFRGKQNTNDIFFGPFANVNIVDQVIQQLERAFLLRSCSDNIFNSRTRPCILYQIKRCSAPCVGKIKTNEYTELVKQAVLFLKGKNHNLKNSLVKKMQLLSKKQDYEGAAIVRDRIKAISRITFEQYSDLNKNENFDILYLYEKFKQKYIQIFFFRSGKNLGNKDFFLTDKMLEKSEILMQQFLTFFYKNNPAPNEILVNLDLKETKLIQKVISPTKSVEIRTPKKGKKLELLKIVGENIKATNKDMFNKIDNNKKILNKLSKVLNLKNFPHKIEIYDNSHLNGTDPVGAMVVYQNFSFSKHLYRKFNIFSSKERINDDYFMLKQVIERRFNFSKKWKYELPNLIIIDGGKGQLNIVKNTIKKLNIHNIDIISISKGKKRMVLNDKVHSLNGEIKFNKNEKEFYFLQQLRDEAHRFAVSSHTKKRMKRIDNSIFNKIKGIGKKTRSNLLNFFGTIANIQSASLADLKKVEGIGVNTAKKIYNEFNKNV